MAQQNVCRYNKYGHCKFAEKCRFMHIDESCENPNCETKKCNLRHPRICSFFRDYKRCKFGEWCSFEHREDPVEKLIVKNQETIERVDEIETLLKEKLNLESKLVEYDKKLEELELKLQKQELLILQQKEVIKDKVKRDEKNDLKKKNITERLDDLQKDNEKKDKEIDILGEKLVQLFNKLRFVEEKQTDFEKELQALKPEQILKSKCEECACDSKFESKLAKHAEKFDL